MYAVAILRYRRPMEDVLTLVELHRVYLRKLKEEGILIASGPFVPRTGAARLLRVPDESAQAALDRIRDDDPFTREGMVQNEVWPWAPAIGKADLDRV
ncbi:MAG: YciI family protein [Gemmatimonadales bacterium]